MLASQIPHFFAAPQLGPRLEKFCVFLHGVTESGQRKFRCRRLFLDFAKL